MHEDDYDPDAPDEDDEIKCKFCGRAVYWGDFYAVDGSGERRLFNAVGGRLHDCKPALDPEAFPE
jgi:hypothetical protein